MKIVKRKIGVGNKNIRNREWKRLHTAQTAAYNKEWYKKNKKKRQKYNRKYHVYSLKNDAVYRLRRNLRKALWVALKNNQQNGKAIDRLGCSILFFKKYISKKFKGNMTWKNYGRVWVLDHIQSISTVNVFDELKICQVCHYSNLQPLFVHENRKKFNRNSV